MCTVTNAQHPDTVGIWLFDEGKRDTANDNPKRKRTAKAYGKVEWAPDKIGQAGKCKPGNYFVADNTAALDLSWEACGGSLWLLTGKPTYMFQELVMHPPRAQKSFIIDG